MKTFLLKLLFLEENQLKKHSKKIGLFNVATGLIICIAFTAYYVSIRDVVERGIERKSATASAVHALAEEAQGREKIVLIRAASTINKAIEGFSNVLLYTVTVMNLIGLIVAFQGIMYFRIHGIITRREK